MNFQVGDIVRLGTNDYTVRITAIGERSFLGVSQVPNGTENTYTLTPTDNREWVKEVPKKEWTVITEFRVPKVGEHYIRQTLSGRLSIEHRSADLSSSERHVVSRIVQR